MLPFLIRTDDDGQSFQVNKRYPKCCPIANGILIDLESCTSMSRDRHHRFSIEYAVELDAGLLSACSTTAMDTQDGMERLVPIVYQFIMPVFCNDFEQVLAFQEVLG